MITRREYLVWSAGAGLAALAPGCDTGRRGPAASPASSASPDSSAPSAGPTEPPAAALSPASPAAPAAPAAPVTTEPASCPPAAPSPPADGVLVREIPAAPAAATFEVSHEAALVWAYAPEPTRARIRLQTRPADGAPFEEAGVRGFELTERTGRTAAIDVTGLAPASRYRYRLDLGNGLATGWYSFVTAPAPNASAPVHFTIGADISNDPRYSTATLDRIAASRAHFLLSLGDWPYTDIPLRDTKLSEYRSSHRVARLAPAAQEVLRAMPAYAIYDDHEVRDNWDGAWALEDPDRMRAGLTAWDEFFPLRGGGRDVLARRRYRTFSWGAGAQFFVLDARRYRSAYRDADGPAKTMLGAEQLAWLQRGLASSRARFKIVATSVPLDFGTTADHWSTYAHERDALLGFIRDRGIRRVVFVTADQHWFAAHHHAGGIREFQVGPLASFLRTPPEPQPPEVVARAVVRNYGEVMITAGRRPRLVFTARDEDGGLLHHEVVE